MTSPGGTADACHKDFSRPSGTQMMPCLPPTDKSVGYFQTVPPGRRIRFPSLTDYALKVKMTWEPGAKEIGSSVNVVENYRDIF